MDTSQSIRFVLNLTRTVVTLLSAAMSLIVLYGILRRYIFHKSVPWVEELALFLMIWITFLGISIAASERTHVGVSFLQDLLPPTARTYLQAAITASMILFLAVAAYQGLLLAIAVLPQRSPALEMSFFWPYASVCVGSFLTIIQLAYLFYRDICSLLSHNTRPVLRN